MTIKKIEKIKKVTPIYICPLRNLSVTGKRKEKFQ